MDIVYLGEALRLSNINNKYIQIKGLYTIEELISLDPAIIESFKAQVTSAAYVIIDLIKEYPSGLEVNFGDHSLKHFVSIISHLVPPHKILLHEIYYFEEQFNTREEYFEKNNILLSQYNELKTLLDNEVEVILVREKEKLDINSYFQLFYQNLYNDYDKTQEVYKVYLWHEDFIRRTWNSILQFNGGYETYFKSITYLNWHQLCFWSNYTNPITNKIVKRVPNLKKGAIYEITPKFLKNDFDSRVIFNFYDANENVISSQKTDKNNPFITVPPKYKYYRMGLRLKGSGEVGFEYIKIRRYRQKGYVSSFDQIEYFDNSDPVIYQFNKAKKSKHLVICFSGVKVNRAEYEFLGVLRDTPIHRLYFLDDYATTGSYYQGRNKTSSLEENIISIINRYAEKYNIPNENIITLGNSKGGGAALYYGFKLGVGTVLASGPTLKWGERLNQNSQWPASALNYIVGEPTEENVEYLNNILINAINIAPSLPVIHFMFVNNDTLTEPYFDDFKNILEKKQISYTTDLKDGNGHNDLIKHVGNWARDKILEIISHSLSRV